MGIEPEHGAALLMSPPELLLLLALFPLLLLPLHLHHEELPALLLRQPAVHHRTVLLDAQVGLRRVPGPLPPLGGPVVALLGGGEGRPRLLLEVGLVAAVCDTETRRVKLRVCGIVMRLVIGLRDGSMWVCGTET